MPSPVPDGHVRGALLPIGGAMDLQRRRLILLRFFDLAGGTNARIVVIPTASELPDGGREYLEVFGNLGVASVDLLPVRERINANDPKALEIISHATGIFMTGGNQLKLTAVLGGTPVATAIRRANARGVPVAGTSAGASAMSAHMIAYGAKGLVPRYGMVQFGPGLGLTNRVVLDQHFGARHRLGRLIAAVSFNPFLIGLGLDENTAAEIDDDHLMQVIGEGSVTVVDGAGITYSNIHQLKVGQKEAIVGVKLHVLTRGWSYDLIKREVIPPVVMPPLPVAPRLEQPAADSDIV
ncbi:cyanophycinase [Herpetosiphon sp. NSE202]|uniref:cyanophycinase n=1 Tax=Herpetosiphon sp. NSE202 TaxID=3351349 RepID=UPI003637D52D